VTVERELYDALNKRNGEMYAEIERLRVALRDIGAELVAGHYIRAAHLVELAKSELRQPDEPRADQVCDSGNTVRCVLQAGHVGRHQWEPVKSSELPPQQWWEAWKKQCTCTGDHLNPTCPISFPHPWHNI
jgi:hypothetical protein